MTASSTGFIPAPLFANANGDIFSPIIFNADGDRPSWSQSLFGSGVSLEYLAKTAVDLVNANAIAQREADARGDAKELKRLQIEEAKLQIKALEAQDALEKSKGANKTNYTMPILVTGGVLILGIGAYFIFRQVKIK